MCKMEGTAWQEVRFSEFARYSRGLLCASVTWIWKSFLVDSQPVCVFPFFPAGTLPCDKLGGQIGDVSGLAAWRFHLCCSTPIYW